MKKLYTLLFLAITGFGFAQTFYSENMGTPSGTTAIAANVFQNTAPIVYSGDGDVRATAVSNGYIGASGAGNVFLTGTAGKFFRIDGLNTAAYSSANLQLKFGYLTNSTATQLLVEQSIDNGTTWTPITFTQNANTSWNLITITGGIQSSATLSLKFTQPATAQMRIDDVSLTNFSASCTLVLGADSTLCNASTLALDTYNATIPFTGAGNATYTIETTSGTVAGDNPSSVAEGNIVIEGITEGTNITVTVTGGTCNFSRDIFSAECKPVNALPHGDSFDYAVDTNLGSTQKWTNVNSGDNVLAVAGSLNYTGINSVGNSVSFSGSGIDPYTPFTSTTSGAIYTGFLMSVTDYSNVTNDLVETAFAVVTDDIRGFKARIFIKKNGAQFQLGCTSATTATPTIYGATLYNVGDVVYVVVGYDFTANELKLWLNPTVAGFTAATPATIVETPATAFANLGGFILRQDGATSTPTMTIDELRVATSVGGLLSVKSNAISGLKVYPNPISNGVLYISTEANTERTVQIFDLLGKQVLNITTSNEEVNVSTLNTGLYVVKITEGGNTATRKLVIK